jgi:hypothetical protein
MKKVTLANSPYHALIDDTDSALAQQYAWQLTPNGYAGTYLKDSGRRHIIYLHRFIAGTPKGLVTDFRNGDKLDARRSNLRVATKSQSQHNCKDRARRSKRGGRYRGTCRTRWGWQAQIQVAGVLHYLGYYPTEEEAAKAYDAAALEHLDEFASLNFPRSAET